MHGGAPETTGWLEGLSYRKYMCKYRDRLPSRPPTRHPETDEVGHGGGTAGGDWQLVTPPSPRPISVKNERAGASPVHGAGGSPVGSSSSALGGGRQRVAGWLTETPRERWSCPLHAAPCPQPEFQPSLCTVTCPSPWRLVPASPGQGPLLLYRERPLLSPRS